MPKATQLESILKNTTGRGKKDLRDYMSPFLIFRDKNSNNNNNLITTVMIKANAL